MGKIAKDTKDEYPEYIKNSYNSRHKTTQSENEQKAQDRHPSKEDIQMANKHLRRCSALIIREMQIKATIRQHFAHMRMVIIKQSQKKKAENKYWAR